MIKWNQNILFAIGSCIVNTVLGYILGTEIGIILTANLILFVINLAVYAAIDQTGYKNERSKT